MKKNPLDAFFAQKKVLVDQALDKYLPKKGKLSQSMRYSVFAGGKRFRPILCLATAKMLGIPEKTVIPYACSIEMIHTFTLIHDDLPSMDNSDLRRGKPSSHKAYGEAVAILAGDALNTLAFKIIANYPRSLTFLSDALLEVVEGQIADIESTKKQLTIKDIEKIHAWKTAALLKACMQGTALIKGIPQKKYIALGNYAQHLGLAFQIADDILDATSTAKELGKPAGGDVSKGFPSLIGVVRSIELAKKEKGKALAALKAFGSEANLLKDIAEYVIERKK